MKKVYVQVIDPVHDTFQSTCSQEPVEDLINHACRLMGFDEAQIKWYNKSSYDGGHFPKMPRYKVWTGYVDDTSKIVTIIEIS